MEFINEILRFIQTQIFQMMWLNNITGRFLELIGIDLNSTLGSALQFFIYDVLKIVILLCTLIFMISYIQSYFPPERSRKILLRFKGIWANTIAALLGTVTPFCSCSSIPLFMGFTSAGLPHGVTFSFLISSPMVDLGSLILLTTIFGIRVGIIYVLLGLVIAIIGGTIIEKLNLEDQIEPFILNAKKNTAIEIETLTKKQRVDFAKTATKETFVKVFPYILVGVGIGAIIHNFIPQSFIERLLGGDNPFGVLIATLVGMPIYADIFGTIPIAEALLDKGAMLGTVLAFMMSVTTLSLPSLIMLKKIIKPKLLSIFILITGVGIVLVGYIFNMLQHLLI